MFRRFKDVQGEMTGRWWENLAWSWMEGMGEKGGTWLQVLEGFKQEAKRGRRLRCFSVGWVRYDVGWLVDG